MKKKKNTEAIKSSVTRGNKAARVRSNKKKALQNGLAARAQ